MYSNHPVSTRQSVTLGNDLTNQYWLKNYIHYVHENGDFKKLNICKKLPLACCMVIRDQKGH